VAWERRGNQRYYYRFRRDGGRVVKQYLGCGAAAEAAAAEDAVRRAERRAQLQAARDLTRTYLPLITNLATLKDAFDAAFHAAATATGHYKHKRQWRKRHHDRAR